jgi:hypothetical protein
MKKRVLLFFCIAFIGMTAKVQSQCNIAFDNLIIQPVGAPVPVGGGKCKYTFNAQFDMTSNNGFKYLFFHSWLAADYPSPPIFDCNNSNAQDPGTNAELGTAIDQAGKSFLDIGFINIPTQADGSTIALTFASTYPHDNSVVLLHPGEPNNAAITATRTKIGATNTYHFVVNNITVIVNQACGGGVLTKTDIWGTNSNAADPKAQCYICGIDQNFGDPTITGFKNCGVPARQYNITISTVDPVVDDLTYKVYLDVNGNGTLETGTDQLAYTSPVINISAPGGPAPDSYVSGLISLPAPYSNSQPWSEMGYLVLVEFVAPTTKNDVVKFLPHPGCIGLPVEFKSFIAARNRSSVLLKWETASERNNSGFAVERNVSGSWEQIAWVPTQAVNGNSDITLTYTYTDLNYTKGISQYRIRQVDMDAKSKYSEIRSVRGEGQLGKTIVYPNPSHNGKVNVVFEDAAVTRDVTVADMNGRTIRQIKGVTNNNITIENLVPGMYTIRIVAPETGEQVVEKVVVNKH